jgi:hypothetical protein
VSVFRDSGRRLGWDLLDWRDRLESNASWDQPEEAFHRVGRLSSGKNRLDPLDVSAWVEAIEGLWLKPELREQAADRLAREFHPRTRRDHGESLVLIARETVTEP